eukprot:CAMPEP_0115842238 /NCGR_PEP_ID=MMETSP0287-20121206/7697_1 /TAXON_ID=412157 /ORGANISM="Chrysochromulina rotalis, Strain UIO044" /LENGTH=296 /DNA_ID=CAMNT_0003295901 /DNA_START=9 /DNA_END=899 /DNA_ORIENTATION=+
MSEASWSTARGSEPIQQRTSAAETARAAAAAANAAASAAAAAAAAATAAADGDNVYDDSRVDSAATPLPNEEDIGFEQAAMGEAADSLSDEMALGEDASQFSAVDDDDGTGGGGSLTSFASVPEAGALGSMSRIANSAGRWASAQSRLMGSSGAGNGSARKGTKAEARAESRAKVESSGAGLTSVPGLSVKKLPSLSAIPERPNDVKVRVHKTKELIGILPASAKNMRLIFLVPKQFRVLSLVTRIQKMLSLDRPPYLRLYDGSGELLRSEATIGSYSEAHGDLSDGMLHVSIGFL